ncbi:aminotransferase class I/II-fold pyridoxal phosphate-dependent enzyme, partial [Raoultella sp. 18073]|uniref:aminotransferase class I/II-fold pyridoxal phosphate-dependent enzyme n=1 Tax=Raoultella sp. 18073 TaxID=2681452 RepID=UPI00190F96D1
VHARLAALNERLSARSFTGQTYAFEAAVDRRYAAVHALATETARSPEAAQALLEPGDEIIIPSPAWPNLAEAVRITGGVPVTVPYRIQPDGRFTLPLADIVAALTPRTRVIMVNSPSNPTGWTMPLSEMTALRDLARARGL